MRITILAVTLVALLLGPVGGVAGEDADLLSSKQTQQLKRLGTAFARKGERVFARELLEIARTLRVDPKALRSVERKLERSKVRAEPADLTKERASLAALLASLSETLDRSPPDARKHLATQMLRLDAGFGPAHAALGRMAHQGRWVAPWIAALDARRTEIAELVRQARRLEIEVETGTREIPALRALYASEATYASAHGITIASCTLNAHKLARALTQALRATALSKALLGDGLELGALSKRTFYLLDTSAKQREAIRNAVSEGGIGAETGAYAERVSTFFDKRGYAVSHWATEIQLAGGLYFYAGVELLRGMVDGKPQACLRLGHMNWVSLEIIGWPSNDVTYYDKAAMREKASRTAAADPDALRHERMLRLAQAGLRGSRTWLGYLIQQGTAPPWSDAFLDQSGKIQGDDRIQCTVMAELLDLMGLSRRLLVETKSATRTDPAEIRTSIEAVIGMSLAELQMRLRDWLLPREPGLMQRMDRGTPPTPLMRAGTPVLRALEAVRKAALPASKVTELIELTELSDGAQKHAKYLAVHDDLLTVWPDVHEQFPDREGYTPEGSRAGSSSVIAPGVDTAAEAIDGWMGTFYHRLPLLQPGLVGVGWALEERIAVLDVSSLVDGWPGAYRVMWPAENAVGVPHAFQPEIPNPVPGVSQAAWGYPITLQMRSGKPQLGLRMRLIEGGDPSGTPVPTHFISPSAPLNPRLAPAESWCLIPKRRLTPKTRYLVLVDGWERDDEVSAFSWSFETR